MFFLISSSMTATQDPCKNQAGGDGLLSHWKLQFRDIVGITMIPGSVAGCQKPMRAFEALFDKGRGAERHVPHKVV